jgi:predicted molibdopterin-dependent oxidoreductase YjgC
VASRRGEIEIACRVTDRVSAGTVFLAFHYREAPANRLTIAALDPQAKIPEFKACAVQVFLARESDLLNPEAVVKRGRY